jgi:hypothetical protein
MASSANFKAFNSMSLLRPLTPEIAVQIVSWNNIFCPTFLSTSVVLL